MFNMSPEEPKRVGQGESICWSQCPSDADCGIPLGATDLPPADTTVLHWLVTEMLVEYDNDSQSKNDNARRLQPHCFSRPGATPIPRSRNSSLRAAPGGGDAASANRQLATFEKESGRDQWRTKENGYLASGSALTANGHGYL
ncbi:hypothetical protein Q7P37_002879 [Cladosporium fusiforme]